MSAPRFDPHDKATLDDIIKEQRSVVERLRYSRTIPSAMRNAERSASDVLQRLLVWQQTCEVQPQ